MTKAIDAGEAELIAWRHHLHRYPEVAFEERQTADFLGMELQKFGLEVHRGLGGTGVVGRLTAGSGTRAIGLRADMDALPLQEAGGEEHRSARKGVMHACGHDGHMAMLLGAARYLARTRRFDGVVYFIFQPAEEDGGGARAMIDDGLFQRFPMDAIHGMHNLPGLPAGHFAMAAGPNLAGVDAFDVTVDAAGTHAAFPNLGTDGIVAAAAIVSSLQCIVSREVNPAEAALVSVTRIVGGDTYNVLPEQVRLSGCCRAFSNNVQQTLREAIKRIASETATAYRTHAKVSFRDHCPPTASTDGGVRVAAAAAADVVEPEALNTATAPIFGADDFGFLLSGREGSYVFIGNGDSPASFPLHNPRYDFNDANLPLGARYWSRLVERELPAGG